MAWTQNEEEIETVLRDAQNWAARSHQDLYAAVHNNNDPGQAGEIGSEWGQFGSEMTEAAQIIAERVRATESGWTGEAADNARTAIKLLSDWVTETAETAVEVGNRVADQGRVMATARSTMPEPVQFQWDAATQMLSAPGLGAFVASAADVQAANEQARGAHEQAVAVMNTMEQESRNVDRTTPVFKPPFNPVTGENEEPVVATARSAGVSLSGASADGAPAARPDGFAASSAGGGTGGAGTGAGAGSGPGAVAASLGTGTGTAWQAATAPAATGSGYAGDPGQWQPGSTDRTTAAAAAYQPTAPTMPTSHGYTGGTMPPSTSGLTWDPTTGQPTGFGTGKNTPAPGTPGATTPGKMPSGPGSPGISGGAGGAGGGAGAKGAFGGAGAFGTGAGAPGGSATQPGGSTGTLQPGQQAQARGGAAPMAPGAAGVAGAAGAPMAGAPGAGRGEEDKEHRSASYIMSGDLFEVPGENLPPAVIGGAKKKKEQDQ